MASFVALSITMAMTRADDFLTTDILDDIDCENETMTVHGTIYVDNWFQFYFNGELIHTDPVAFIPHNGENVTFSAPVCGQWSFAIYATDYSDNVTGK